MNSFSFEDKDPRFTRLKPFLALRLLSKGLFYIRAMEWGQLPPLPPQIRDLSLLTMTEPRCKQPGILSRKPTFHPRPPNRDLERKAKKKVRGNRILATAV